MVEYPNKAESYPKLIERLSQPLLGLSCIPSTTSLTVVQLSNTGDLFYQKLFPHKSKLQEVSEEGRVQYYEDLDLDLTAGGGCGSKKPNLGENDLEFITKWVECLTKHVDKESKDAQEDENYDSEDVGIIREELFSCLGDSSSNTSELSHQIDKVRKAYRQGKVLTKKSIGLSYEPETLQMFDEGVQCSEPLGNVLLRNWYSDEPVPIDLTGKQNTENEEEKQNVVEDF